MLTMSSALDRARRVHGGNPAIVEPLNTHTWAEHVGRVARAAGALRSRGLAPGERFGILSRNSSRQCELLHAGYWSGIIPVPINVRLAAPEIAFILRDASCRGLAVDPALAGFLDKAELSAWKDRAFMLGPAADVTRPARCPRTTSCAIAPRPPSAATRAKTTTPSCFTPAARPAAPRACD